MKLSRKRLRRLCEKHCDNRPKLKRMLIEAFSDPDNILVFGYFLFPHHFKKNSPKFHREILELLQNSNNVGIAAPRGHAKSTLIDLVYLAWITLYQKSHFTLLISDTITQSIEFVNTLKEEFEENIKIKWLYGDLRSDFWRDGNFVTSTGIKVMARGFGSKIRGLKFKQYRPELLLFDDLENDESVQSSDQREKLKSWFTRAALPALAKGARAIMVGTIMHSDSLLQNIISKHNEFASWTVKLYKALNYDKATDAYFALWPSLYTVDELIRKRDDPTYQFYVGTIVFAQELQNEPHDDSEAIIKGGWIQYVDHLPNELTFTRKAVTADPAISKKDKADFFAKSAGVVDRDGNLYIYKMSNKHLSFQEGVDDLRAWNTELKPNILAIETVVFAQAYAQSLMGLPIMELIPDKDKRRRTIAVSKFFESGKIFFVRGMPEMNIAYDQLTHFTGDGSIAHDDLLDSIVMLIEVLLVRQIGTYGDLQKKQESDERAKPITAGMYGMQF